MLGKCGAGRIDELPSPGQMDRLARHTDASALPRKAAVSGRKARVCLAVSDKHEKQKARGFHRTWSPLPAEWCGRDRTPASHCKPSRHPGPRQQSGLRLASCQLVLPEANRVLASKNSPARGMLLCTDRDENRGVTHRS